MVSEKDKKNVIDRIQREELAELTKALVDIPSPTGAEKAIGEFILDWYFRHVHRGFSGHSNHIPR